MEGEMHMSFWFSFDLGDFLFGGLKVTSTAAFAVTCLALFLLALSVEGLKTFRAERSKRLSMSSHAYSNEHLLVRNSGTEASALLSGHYFRGKIQRSCRILKEVFLYLIQDSMNWIIMLAVMGYNGYIFMVVLAGAGFGYAIFGDSLAHSKMENLRLQLQSEMCGECQVKDEDAIGQSDPPIQSLSSSGPVNINSEVTVHFNTVSDGSA